MTYGEPTRETVQHWLRQEQENARRFQRLATDMALRPLTADVPASHRITDPAEFSHWIMGQVLAGPPPASATEEPE